MGRLTLNVLLSFAQFEREVTGERIRDKIAASKARGIWMGGSVPVGYDLGERRLVVNGKEAELVRQIFERYLELRSLVALAKDLDLKGVRTKRWTARNGKERGGYLYNHSGLAYLLRNTTYLGEVKHNGKSFPGEHDAIVDCDLFERVQEQLAANRHKLTSRRTRAAKCPLHMKIFDAQGRPMGPSFSYGRGKKIYRYYVSPSLLPQGRVAAGSCSPEGDRISADRVERLLQDRLGSLLEAVGAPNEIFNAIKSVTYSPIKLKVVLELSALFAPEACRDTLLAKAQEIDPTAELADGNLILPLDARPISRGRTLRSKDHYLDDTEKRLTLAELVRTSHRKLQELNASPLFPEAHRQMTAPTNEWTRERIAIGLLAPDIQKALLTGTAPAGLEPEMLLSRDIPLDWEGQRKFLGFTKAS
jgi:hypothetical protein